MRTVGVAGFGAMGAGIGQVCLEAGYRVVAWDGFEGATARGCGRVRDGLARRVAKGQLTEEAAASALGSLSVADDLDLLADVDLVIEAIVEELLPKQQLFSRLHAMCRPDVTFATNTSALSVSAIAGASGRPERVVGLHFFNPAPLMRLVEVVRTVAVDPEVFAEALAFATTLGKEAVPCADTPGFLVNRILIPVLNDAVRVMEETGASADDIDRAMRFGAGWPMGPFALMDMIGLDVQAHASAALHDGLHEPRMAAPARLQRLVELGRLGRKTGRGFHEHGA